MTLITFSRIIILFVFAMVLNIGAIPSNVYAQPDSEIRLVLQITIDGLRADLINRYENGFGEGGFRLLMEKGTYFTNAHYQHANTETIVGHATLATGTFPSQHGMVGNVWFDREDGELAYNIEDPDHPLIATREKESQGAQVDPAQKKSRTQGRSPAVLLAPTVGDGLAAYYGGRSKIFGVSGKDRSAVSMAGHAGKAFWYSTNTGDFVTSTYYYDAYPDWVSQWNSRRQAEGYAGKSWFLFDYGPIKTMHGSPWRYDTHVPIIFMGPGMQPQTVDRRVHPVDVAPTIAAVLGMTPPGSAQGLTLEEVFQKRIDGN